MRVQSVLGPDPDRIHGFVTVMRRLAHDFRGKGVAVAILHPGLVATEMTGRNGIPTSESAQGLIARMDDLQLGDSGGFWHANGERLPW